MSLQSPPTLLEMRVYPPTLIPGLEMVVRKVLFNDFGTPLIDCPLALVKEGVILGLFKAYNFGVGQQDAHTDSISHPDS